MEHENHKKVKKGYTAPSVRLPGGFQTYLEECKKKYARERKIFGGITTSAFIRELIYDYALESGIITREKLASMCEEVTIYG